MATDQQCLLCGSNKKRVYIHYNDHSLYKCKKCGFIFSDFLLNKKETEEYYNEYDFRYLLKYKAAAEYRGKKILNYLHKYIETGTILDVGCGCGFFLNVAKKLGWKSSGIELSSGACDYAQKEFGLEVHNSDVRDAEFKQYSFDVITLQHLLEHIPEPHEILAELKPRLKDDGMLVIVVPNARSFMSHFAHKHWLCLAEKTHLFHYSAKTITKICNIAGFNVLSIKTFQWNVMDILWALKMFLAAPKSSTTQPPNAVTKYTVQTTKSKKPFMRRFINKLFYPLNSLICSAGFGGELIVFANKRHQ